MGHERQAIVDQELGALVREDVYKRQIADMLPAPRINDVLHRVTFAAGWELSLIHI